MQLRDYQLDGKFKINKAWELVRNVLYVLPTGGGKTVTFGDILNDHVGASCAIAHRQELVSQISSALAKFGIMHKIIAPKNLIHDIVKMHVDEVGRSFYSPAAHVAVAGVDTLIRRANTMRDWLKSVTLWVTDEAHHVLKDNKWGKACALFPNAKGLGVTATPIRADGAGLGSHADGLMDAMIEGATMRELINRGYLTDYKLFAPPSDLDLTGVDISDRTGEYSPKQLKQRAMKSHIVGDVIQHYLRIAPGKLGITFAIDVEEATKIAAEFNDAGIPAAVISAKTPDRQRALLLRKFKNRELLQLVNVDLFGEGFDLPSLECVSMARPTQSYSLYAQQFGRVLRILEGKQHGIVIDHVGNISRHGLPDRAHIWSLDRREKASRQKRDPDDIPLKTCKNPACSGIFEAIYKICPYCGTIDVPSQRSAPEFVDGDLIELDAATLARMRGDIDAINSPAEDLAILHTHAPQVAKYSAMKRHRITQESQERLRTILAWIGGYYESMRYDVSESMKRFYFRFGIDSLTAQALKAKDADQLSIKILDYLYKIGVYVIDDSVINWYADQIKTRV